MAVPGQPHSELLWQLGPAGSPSREPVIALVWQRLAPLDLVRLRRTSRACADEAKEAARRLRSLANRAPTTCPVAWGVDAHHRVLAAIKRSDAEGRDSCARLWYWFGGWNSAVLGWTHKMQCEVLREVCRRERHETANRILGPLYPSRYTPRFMWWSKAPYQTVPNAAVLLDMLECAERERTEAAMSMGTLARLLDWSVTDSGMIHVLSTICNSRDEDHAVALFRGMQLTRLEALDAANELDDGSDLRVVEALRKFACGPCDDTYDGVTYHEIRRAVANAGGSETMAARVFSHLGLARQRRRNMTAKKSSEGTPCPGAVPLVPP